MKPIDKGGHPAYQKLLISNLKEYYPDAIVRFGPSTWQLIDSFYNLDLSQVDTIMADRYSVRGPAPRLPSDMLRCILVALHMKSRSYTSWASTLKTDPLAAILSGFPPNDTPGVGTFYDFSDRLWLSNDDNLSPHAHPRKKRKVKKPKNPNDKAQPVEDYTVEQLIQKLQNDPPDRKQPFARLFTLFNEIFLKHSMELSLIDPAHLVLSGDGTEVETSARFRYRTLCHCAQNGIFNCSCNRYYSQPDTDCGYDSSRHKYYYGYNLYMLTAADSYSDLPVFPLLNPASMHDSFALCYTYASMKAFLRELKVSELLLDSAHDGMPIYKFCQENSIAPIIDLNERSGVSFPYKNNYTIGSDGVPVCEAGLKMWRDGTDHAKKRVKYRCPKACHFVGVHCSHKCSDSPYGRVVYTATKDNPRIFTIPPRESAAWKKEYAKRTSSERCNKREKVDYLLESGRHHSTKMWYCRLYCIMMCQHLDAWGQSLTNKSVKDLLQSVR